MGLFIIFNIDKHYYTVDIQNGVEVANVLIWRP